MSTIDNFELIYVYYRYKLCGPWIFSNAYDLKYISKLLP